MPQSKSRTPSLSPPPLKRRRISPPQLPPQSLSQSSSSPPPRIDASKERVCLAPPDLQRLRILSWNINGIDAFLPTRSRDQKAITSFFPTGRTSKTSSRDHKTHSDETATVPSLRRCLRRWHYPHIVCLQEVKIARSDRKTQDAVREIVNPTLRSNHSENQLSDDEQSGCEAPEYAVEGGDGSGPGYDVYFSLSRDKHNARGLRGNGKVYGVCTLVRQDIVCVLQTGTATPEQQLQEQEATTKEVDWDLEGRVLVTLLAYSRQNSITIPSRRKSLAVFNVYAVNGTTNPHRDSSTGTIIGDRHAQKRRFHTLLASTIKDYQEQGYQVVIAGDLNVSRTPLDSYPSLRLGTEHVRNRADFEEKFMEQGLGMVDSFRHIHGLEKRYSYRPPSRPWGAGMDRVDLILCSNTMGSSEGLDGSAGSWKEWRLIDADILDAVEERGPSDHVPLFVDVSSGDSGVRV